MKVEVCHTISTETIDVDLPDEFVQDLAHVVVIHEGEAYQLKSTIPDEIKKKNALRKEFEDKEFEYLRTNYYLDLDEDADPDEFEKDFIDHVKNLVYGHYPELQAIIDESASNESIYHTLCIHFVIYAIYKNREDKLRKKNAEQKSDKCYAKDYSKRIINLFKILDIKNPGSIRKFSEELNTLEKFMKGDERRHAGYDKLFTGISTTVNMLANVFITNDGEQKINLVKAFEDMASSTDKDFMDKENADRKLLIEKISKIIDNTISYYENYIVSIEKTEKDIEVLNPDISAAYMIVARGLVAQFINSTDAFLKNSEPNATNNAEALKKVRDEYKKQLEMFCNYFDDLVAAFDDVTDNTTPDSVFATNLNYIWFNINKARSSESETWPTDLARLLFDHYNEIFKDVPTTFPTKQNSN